MSRMKDKLLVGNTSCQHFVIIYVAKCNLGTVRIEPMLDVGLCLTWISGLPLKHM